MARNDNKMDPRYTKYDMVYPVFQSHPKLEAATVAMEAWALLRRQETRQLQSVWAKSLHADREEGLYLLCIACGLTVSCIRL